MKNILIVSNNDMCRIPMANGVDSLNVAAASAIAFWQLRVQNDTDLPPSPDDVHI